MGPLTRNGKRLQALIIRIVSLAAIIGVGAPLSRAQSSVICNPSAVPTLVRTEGIAERVGDIILQCVGSPGAVSVSNLTLFLPANIANRISAANVPDVIFTIDTGGGPVPANASIQLTGVNAISFSGLTFTVPVSGQVTFRIANVRADVNQLGLSTQLSVVANLASNAFSFTRAQVTVAFPNRGLLSIGTTTSIPCTGSPLPVTITLSNLFAAGTRFTSTRFTEGYAQAFVPKDPASDTGTRILINYTGFPAGARLFIPDAIAGSSAQQPTSGGDLGLARSGGVYAPVATGSLLLARVSGADARGAGGSPVYLPGAIGSGAVAFDSASEVSLTNGAGTAVYEVLDANPSVQESAQFPTFLGLSSSNAGGVGNLSISFAPISSVTVASTSEPVPRFSQVPPPSDCASLGDCGANYFPSLFTDLSSLNFSGVSGGPHQLQYLRVRNQGGGTLQWTDSIVYQNGAGWLTLDQTSGINNTTLAIDAHPDKLAAGKYSATLLIDAGPLAGTRSIPVTLTVAPAPPPAIGPASPAIVPPAPKVMITSVSNAAALAPGPLVAGSLGTLKGTNLAGKSVAVAFDGVVATVLYGDSGQINFQVPDAVSAKNSSQMVVTVDGIGSLPQTVALAPIAPAIFPGAVLNQDSTVNSRSNPAAAGSVLQIFATGLLSPASVLATAKIHDRDDLVPLYADAAPGLIGVQQVNVLIPADLPGMQSEVKVCGMAAAQRFCSLPVPVFIQ